MDLIFKKRRPQRSTFEEPPFDSGGSKSQNLVERVDRSKMFSRRGSRNFGLIFGLVLQFLLIQSVQGQSFVSLSSEPITVQSKDAKLIINFALGKAVNAGGWIKLTFPEQMTVSPSTTNCVEDQGLITLSCSVDVAGNYIEFVTQDDIKLDGTTTQNYQISADTAINLRDTIETVSGIKLTTVSGFMWDATFTAEQGNLTAATLTPTSQVVGADTSLTVAITTKHRIPRKGKIHVYVSDKWNVGSDNPLNYFSSVTCSDFKVGGAPVTEAYVCSFLDDNRVEVDGGFVAADVPEGTDISIRILGFRNPITTNVPFEVFNVYTTDEGELNIVDSLDASVMITQAAQLTGGRFAVSPPPLQVDNIGIVQEKNTMRLSYSAPVPLQANCHAVYWFPTEYYDASQITSIRTGTLFASAAVVYTPAGQGAANEFTLKDEGVVDGNAYKSISFTGCDSFRRQRPETTTIFGLSQPRSTKPTASLKVYISDEQDHLVAFFDSDVSFTPIAGTMSLVSASLNPSTVYAGSELTWTIEPTHSLYANDTPSVTIELPTDYEVPRSCSTSNTGDPFGGSRSCESNTIQNTVTINNLVDQDFVGGGTLTFTTSAITLPHTSAGGQGEFRLTTYVFDTENNERFGVDATSASGVFTITAGGFNSAEVTSSSSDALVQAEHTFKIVPMHLVPQYAIIMVVYPPEVEISDPSLSQTLCTGWQGFTSETPVCTIFTANRTIIVSKGFQQSDGGAAGSTNYQWTIPYLTNPPTLRPTGPYAFTILDQFFAKVDQIVGDGSEPVVTLQISNAAVFQSIQLELASYQNAERTTYTFTLVPSCDILSENKIRVIFPKQISLPENEGDLSCTSPSINYFESISCTKTNVTVPGTRDDPNLTQTSDNAVLIEFTLKSNIPALETFSFAIGNVLNPVTTAPTDPIGVQIFASEALETVTNQDSGTLIVITSVAFDLEPGNFALNQSVKGAGLASTFTINVTLAHDIAAGGGLLIRYPTEVVVEGELEVEVDATTYDTLQKLTNPVIDYSARQILFTDPQKFDDGIQISDDVNKTQELVITIIGLRNPLNNEASASFEVVTFNRENDVLYFIDQVISGLEVASNCDYPCKDCPTSDPTFCLSCFPLSTGSTMPFLQENTCLEKCSDGLYPDEFDICQPCDSTCLKCEFAANNCTQCGVGDYLYLNPDENECVTNCPVGYINQPSINMCEKCREGCASCDYEITNCTSCAPLITPFLFKYDCREECPPGISIPPKGAASEGCALCDPSCKTCDISVDNCTSCEDFMRYDSYNGKCLEACLPDVQIYNNAQQKCETCQENCITCVGDIETCTSCKDGFVLNIDSTCQPECREGDPEKQTAVDGVCKECEQPCKSCDGAVDRCTTCINEFLLYDGTCVDHCPDKYEANNATVNQCILVGLICPEGFHINTAGDGCIPNEFECEPGYEINKKNTACIPAPGSPVPFPFLFMSVCLALVVLGSYMKERTETKVCTCLIFMIGSWEILQYFLIGIYSFRLEDEIYFAGYLAFLGLLALIASNLAFAYYYLKHTMADRAYADWIRLFPTTKCLLPILVGAVNLKLVRFVFSGFFGMENCLAQFDNPKSAIHQQLKMLTLFQCIFAYSPIFLADLIIISRVGWGHQILVLAIETFLLQILMMLLTYFEFKDPEGLYTEGEVDYSSLKPRKSGQIAVMGAFEDEGMDETHLVRVERRDHEYEVNLRKQALIMILEEVGKNFLQTETNKGQADLGGDILKLKSKGKKKSYFYRETMGGKQRLIKAASCEDLTAHSMQKTRGGTDGTKVDEDYDDESSQEEVATLGSDDSKYLILKNRERRFSYPLASVNRTEEDVADPFFANEVTKIKTSIIEERYRDNCGVEVKKIIPPGKQPHVRKKKMVNRRTQTYLRELLQLRGEPLQDSDMEIVMEEEAEIDDQYTKGLINGVIDCISESSKEPATGDAKQRKPKKRKDKNVPDFELNEIMGEFEIDDAGNYIIERGEQGELLDSAGRPVNKRGYLVDKLGNVINTKDEIIFKAADLDSDDEIPAPYGFEKRKENLLNMEQEQQFQVNTYGNGPGRQARNEGDSENEEDIVEKQFLRLKQGEQMSSHSGSRSQIGEPLAGHRNFMVDENGNIDDMIDIITKKTVPVKKEKLGSVVTKTKKVVKKQGNNPPPKRFTPGDQLFVQGPAVDAKEQKKLHKIAESIGGFANQVADNIAKSSNHDLDELRGMSLGRDSGYQGHKLGPYKQATDVTSIKRTVQGGQGDFYGQISRDQSQSVISQDIVYMNENLAQRAGSKGTRKLQKGMSDADQLKKAYGGTKIISQEPKQYRRVGPEFMAYSREESQSPGLGGRMRPESSGMKLTSGDPRLKGLESIYLSKFSKVGSQKNIAIKKSLQGGQSRVRGAFMQYEDGDQMVEEDFGQYENQRQVVVADTIDRLQQEYSDANQVKIGANTITEGFIEKSSQPDDQKK